MKRLIMIAGIALSALTACDRAPPTNDSAAGAENAAAPASATPAASPDAELEQLKTTAPVDACTWLTPEKLATVYPNLTFEVHQKLEPRMSGYVWDSRCTYWAGMGTHEFAKDVPTHTVEIFVATSVSEDKAKANLASRHETATTTTGYLVQPSLGANAYSTANIGYMSLFFVNGQSEVQINVSSLDSTNEQKIKEALALAQTL